MTNRIIWLVLSLGACFIGLSILFKDPSSIGGEVEQAHSAGLGMILFFGGGAGSVINIMKLFKSN